MAEKRYYWIKLKTDFFNKEEIEFVINQENGCEYIVLFIMLCTFTANSNGRLESKVGNMIIPYNINKIVRDTKIFDFDTVVVALELFKKAGLIYEDEDKVLVITNYDNMVGSECSSANRVRNSRKKKLLQCNNNVTQENRDKILENREEKKELDLHTYSCHLNKSEKEYFCLDCHKKNVCNKPTSDKFKLMFGCTFENYINKKDNEEIPEIYDYNWLEEEDS